MEEIFYKETLVGIRVSAIPKGTAPVTDEREPLQMLTLKHPKGTYLKAHMHAPKERTTARLQECLIVRTGTIEIDLYEPGGEQFKTITLSPGEAFILLRGGYGIRVTEDAELIEVKNGPYLEDKILLDDRRQTTND